MTEATLLTDAGHTRKDLRQMESAIRKGWALSDNVLENLPKVLVEVVARGSMPVSYTHLTLPTKA